MIFQVYLSRYVTQAVVWPEMMLFQNSRGYQSCCESPAYDEHKDIMNSGQGVPAMGQARARRAYGSNFKFTGSCPSHAHHHHVPLAGGCDFQVTGTSILCQSVIRVCRAVASPGRVRGRVINAPTIQLSPRISPLLWTYSVGSRYQ